MAIDLQNSSYNSLENYFYSCQYNWISDSKYGIHLRNIYSNSSGDVSVFHNQIYFTKPADKISGYERGIWLEKDGYCHVTGNHISSTQPTPIELYAMHLIGIEFNASTDCEIIENYIGQMGFGMFGLYSCKGTNLRCNNINDFCSGINCKQLTLLEQGDLSNDESWKNEWNGTMTGSNRISGEPAVLIKWDYQLGTKFEPFPFENNIDPNIVTNGDPNCTTPDISTPMLLREKYFEKTAFHQNQYSSDSLFHQYYDQLLFYSGISKDTSLLYLGTSDDVVYQTLYHNLKDGNIGVFYKIDSLIGNKNYVEASAIINQLVDQNILEYYKKVVEQIYIDKEYSNRELSSSERSTLEIIAREPGIYGGEAVYMARAILKIFVDEDFAAMRSVAPEFYTNKKSLNEVSHALYLHPNPATHEVNVYVTGIDNQSGYISLINALGGKIYLIKISNGTPYVNINLEDLEPGVYIVALKINNTNVKTGRLVVLR